MRTIVSLNQNWTFYKTGAPGEGRGVAVTLPHTWNAADGQDGGGDYYRGRCWYTRPLDKADLPPLQNGARAWLEFEGAALEAEVYLNGEKLAEHKGGFSTFRVDLTDRLKDRNELAVAVSNARSGEVYPQQADFTFYGGLYRNVSLIAVPETHFALSGRPFRPQRRRHRRSLGRRPAGGARTGHVQPGRADADCPGCGRVRQSRVCNRERASVGRP